MVGNSQHIVIVGAGPAGAALAVLLAERGISTTLIERQTDFAREFRGEVLMPGGLRVLELLELDLEAEQIPHRRPARIDLYRGQRLAFSAELREPGPKIVSQPELLEALVARAARHSCFELIRGGSVRDLMRSGDRVCGVEVADGGATREIRADLVVGADGRSSIVRRRIGVGVPSIGTPMDIVWCKLPLPDLFETAHVRAYVGHGHLLVALPAPDGRLQVAWVILKGTYGELKSRGIDEWVESMADHVSPDLAVHLRASTSEISRPFLLVARTEHVETWASPGALLIGDAAHTMSPVGGQGLNVALRDAIVAANVLVPALRAQSSGAELDAAVAEVERQRRAEITAIQRLAALPPRLIMRAGPFSEPARVLALAVLRTPFARIVAGRRVSLFLNGSGEVVLRV